MKNIVIFASGAGSNALKICSYFSNHDSIKVAAVFCNNPNARIIEHLKGGDIPVFVFNRDDFYGGIAVEQKLKEMKADYLVLAGFLWLMPQAIVESFRDKIINIHPALLPKFGGKGMYGKKVHEAVILNKEKESGITIHLADEHYDEGKILLQEKLEVNETDTAESLAAKINALELEHFAPALEKYILANGR